MKKLFTLLLIFISTLCYSQSTTVVISQVYGGGGAGSGTPTYKYDYVELHNISGATQILTGYSLQYGSSTGNFGNSASAIYSFPVGTSIPAGGYLLIQLGTAGTVGGNFPVSADLVSPNISMAAGSGKIALVNGTTAVGCGATATPCNLSSSIYIDVVSYGASNNGEGGTTVNNGTALTNAQGAVRKNNGCTETDNNNLDFDVVSNPIPRNAASTAVSCIAVPTPTTTSISPSSATTGSPSFTITVNGTNFTNASVVTWNGSALTTNYVSATQLTATVPSSNIATAGTATVGVTTTGAAASSNTQTFTINAAPSLSAGTLNDFGSICINTTLEGSFTVTGSNLTSDITVGALPGFGYAKVTGGPYTSTLTLTPVSGSINQTVYVQFAPTTPQSYNGTISITGGGTSSATNVSVTGSGLNTAATVTTGNSANVTPTSADLSGSVTSQGCSTVTAYGIEYSLTSGFVGGTGTSVSSGNPTATNFSVGVTGLLPNTSYYYHAYATNGGGTVYGAEMSFTTAQAPPAGAPLATSATNITTTGFTANWNAVAGATNYRLDVYTAPGVYVSGYQDLSVGNVTSYIVTGLNASTNYYYVVRAESAGGTSGNSNEITVVTTANPALTAGTLAGFGNTCINSTGVGSFTLSGTDLTTANITVGPLAGYSFATSANGPFTASLDLTQSGGTFSQTIYVQFNPTAAQSYDGSITINGGGILAPVSVAVTGSGVNTPASVTTNTATNITINSATLNGTISATGCSAVTAYGFEYSTTAGFTAGSGTAVSASNLSNGSFSLNLNSLTPTTNYYVHAFATNGGGTVFGAEQSFTTLTPVPVFTTGTVTGFGNVCLNNTTAANSFAINGAYLTNAPVVVGPLAGYAFATTANGTYTNTLTIVQPGGNFSQTVYVQFTPTVAQSYNGNIPVSGGGVATASNVAVTGSGINSAPTVTTGTATAITAISATAGGAITATGCTNVTAYGIEYSTTAGFANGSGTKVAASNLASGSFTATLSGLTANTKYYFKAYATNGGGTAYGTEQNFTTATPQITVSALTGFGSSCINTVAGPNSFTITGTNLTAANVTVGPLTGFTFATTATGTYASSLTLPQTGGAYSQTVYVKFAPTATQVYNGNIAVTGGGVTTTVNAAATGTGVNNPASVITGGTANQIKNNITLYANVAADGCSPATAYGFEYSGTSNFSGGQGTKWFATNLSGGNFTLNVRDLIPGATYYYKAFVTNNGGTAYGATQSFTVPALPGDFTLFPVPIARGRQLNFSMVGLTPGYYALVFYNAAGQRVYEKAYNVQSTFINEHFTVPSILLPGVYQVQLVSSESAISTKMISIY